VRKPRIGWHRMEVISKAAAKAAGSKKYFTLENLMKYNKL
jgi:hypothetical protein